MDDRVICGKFYQGHNDRDGIDGQPVQGDGVGGPLLICRPFSSFPLT